MDLYSLRVEPTSQGSVYRYYGSVDPLPNIYDTSYTWSPESTLEIIAARINRVLDLTELGHRAFWMTKHERTPAQLDHPVQVTKEQTLDQSPGTKVHGWFFNGLL